MRAMRGEREKGGRKGANISAQSQIHPFILIYFYSFVFFKYFCCSYLKCYDFRTILFNYLMYIERQIRVLMRKITFKLELYSTTSAILRRYLCRIKCLKESRNLAGELEENCESGRLERGGRSRREDFIRFLSIPPRFPQSEGGGRGKREAENKHSAPFESLAKKERENNSPGKKV